MLQHQRRHRILELVKERKTCTIDDLREELKISSITLYRDLRRLDEEHLIHRVHGGVTLREPDPVNWRFSDRLKANAPAKERIGRVVAEWIQEGWGIYTDASSTTYLFAQSLAKRGPQRLTLVTNSPSIPLVFEAFPQVRVISTGGELHHTLNAYGGPIATRVLEEMNFDAAYLSCAGFDLMHGATTDAPVLAELTRAVARRARQVVLLLDSSKFSRLAMMTSLRASEISTLVTDAGAPQDVLCRVRDAGITVVVAGADAGTAGQERSREETACGAEKDVVIEVPAPGDEKRPGAMPGRFRKGNR